METRNLGSSGLKVPTLCLGTMTFGEANEDSFMHKVGCDEATSSAIMNRALDTGVNFFDTADVYGQDGLTERVIGNWFEKEKRRNEVILATKMRFRMGEGANRTGASRYRIRQTVEDSLRRLKTDHIDLYQIHMQDVDTPEDETLRALDDLVRQGKVLYIGASNYTAYRLANSQWISQTQNLERFVSLQAQYSLVVRDLEREHTPLCRERGIGILPWSPLAGGFLTGKYKKDESLPEGARLGKWSDRYEKQMNRDKNWRIIEAVRGVASELDATPAQIALAWLMHKPMVTSVIFGARSIEQYDDNRKAADIKIPDSLVQRLDEASAPYLGYPYDFMSSIQGRW